MKTKEIIFIIFIVSYTTTIFTIVTIDKAYTMLNSESQPLQMVELFGNGTARNYEIESPYKPNIFSVAAGTLGHFMFTFPFVLAGFGMWGMSIVWANSELVTPIEIHYQWLSFFIPSMISIPVATLLSTQIPLWRRIPYIYLIAMFIAGTPIFMNGDFGR